MATLRKQLLLVSLCFAAAYPSGGSEFGLAFLAANKAKPGVVELPSGLQYKVLVNGEGKDHPTKDSPCASMVRTPSWWCHSLLPWPPGADSHRTWPHNAPRTSRGAAQGPMGGSRAARRPGRKSPMLWRSTRRCFCHYEGRTAANYPSGDKFDSSYDRGQPAKFAPNQVGEP